MKQTIDWGLARERVQASANAVDNMLAESPLRIEKAYRERARRLALRPRQRRPAIQEIPVLVFKLAQESYAIELTDLAEVLPLKGCTRVPGASPRIRGVINLRGNLRTVVDLGRLLLPSGTVQSRSGFVLMVRRRREIGLAVDQVEEMREIIRDELTPSPISGQASFSKGIAAGALVVLDLDRVLAEVLASEEPTAA